MTSAAVQYPEPAQHPLHALEVLHLQQRFGLLDLRPGLLRLPHDGGLGRVRLHVLGQARVGVQTVRVQPLLEGGDLLHRLLEGGLADLHVLDRVQQRLGVSVPLVDFLQALEYRRPTVSAAEVAGHEDADAGDLLDEIEVDGNDDHLSFVLGGRGGRERRQLVGVGALGGVAADVQQGVHHVGELCVQWVVLLFGRLLLEVDDDAPAEVLVVVLDANESAGLHEGDHVLRTDQPRMELLAQ